MAVTVTADLACADYRRTGRCRKMTILPGTAAPPSAICLSIINSAPGRDLWGAEVKEVRRIRAAGYDDMSKELRSAKIIQELRESSEKTGTDYIITLSVS